MTNADTVKYLHLMVLAQLEGSEVWAAVEKLKSELLPNKAELDAALRSAAEEFEKRVYVSHPMKLDVVIEEGRRILENNLGIMRMVADRSPQKEPWMRRCRTFQILENRVSRYRSTSRIRPRPRRRFPSHGIGSLQSAE